MANRSSPRVPSNSQDNSHESMSGKEEALVVCFSNEEEKQHSGNESNPSSNNKDATLVSCGRGIVGTKHFLEDLADDFSKKVKIEEHKKNEKATVPSSPKKADGLELVETSAVKNVQHETKLERDLKNDAISGLMTVEEEVLHVLSVRYFDAPEEQVHLGDALRAVIIASGGSLTTIQFLTKIFCTADRDFVAKTVFKSESLTPTVAHWIVDWINKQDTPSTHLVHMLRNFVCGNAPLAAGNLLLQNVDINSIFVLDGIVCPLGLHCVTVSKDCRVNDVRLLLVLGNLDNSALKWLLS